MPRRDETEPVETIPVSTFLLDYREPTDGIDILLGGVTYCRVVNTADP
jgi:hypothetical protein